MLLSTTRLGLIWLARLALALLLASQLLLGYPQYVWFSLLALGGLAVAFTAAFAGFPIVKAANDRTQLFSFWIGMYR